jgi:predicted phosphodiesterase
MTKLAILGDAHVRHRTWPRLELYGDAATALREVVDTAKAEDAVLVCTGDLLEVGVGADTPRCIDELLRATAGVGDAVYAIGNHDRTGAAGGAKNPEWVTAVLNRKHIHHDEMGAFEVGDNWWHEECRVIEVRGVRFVVIHHQISPEAFDEKLKAIEEAKLEFDVLVCHQGIDKLLRFKGAYEITEADLVPRVAARGCRLVCCGHVHVSEHWTRDGVTIVSPGPTYAETFSDDEAPRFPIVTLEPARVEVEWRELKQQRVVARLFAMSEDNSDYDAALARIDALKEEAVLDSLPETVAKPVLSLVYVPRPGFKRMLEERANGEVCLDLTPISDAECLLEEAAPDAGDQPTDELDADIERITALHTLEGPVRDILIAIQRGAEATAVIEQEIAKIMA